MDPDRSSSSGGPSTARDADRQPHQWRFAQCFGDKSDQEADITEGEPLSGALSILPRMVFFAIGLTDAFFISFLQRTSFPPSNSIIRVTTWQQETKAVESSSLNATNLRNPASTSFIPNFNPTSRNSIISNRSRSRRRSIGSDGVNDRTRLISC